MEIKWKLSDAADVHLTRNVGGIFRLHNDGDGEIYLVPQGDRNAPDYPANHIPKGRSILLQIAAGSDVVIRLVPPAREAKGTLELVTPA
jgi:hypothetical protein